MNADHALLDQYAMAVQKLNEEESNEWSRVVQRLEMICKRASEKNIAVLVDAEEAVSNESSFFGIRTITS